MKARGVTHTTSMALSFRIVDRTRFLGAARPIVARLHYDHVTVRHGQLHHVGGGLFSSLWSGAKRLVVNFLRSDTAQNLGRQAATFAGDAAKQAAVEGAKTLAENVAQTRLAGVLPPQSIVSAAESLNPGALVGAVDAGRERAASALGSGIARLRSRGWTMTRVV